MRRVLLVGAGDVGAKHLSALTSMPQVRVVGIADPALHGTREGVPVFASWRAALTALSPEVVVVATPPGVALAAARDAAASAATVLVEKPVATDPTALAPQQPGDSRIWVAFQPHFAPGIAGLLTEPPAVLHAEVGLAVRRDAPYFRGWRRTHATAGGILHQQAIHGLALALRLLPGDIDTVDARTLHHRGLAEIEDHITASLTFSGGATLHLDARVDFSGPPTNELLLGLADGRRLHLRGRNLEAGLGEPSGAPTHAELRRAMYTALLDTHEQCHGYHPCLFPLMALKRPLEVIDHVYRNAHADHDPVPAPA